MRCTEGDGDQYVVDHILIRYIDVEVVFLDVRGEVVVRRLPAHGASMRLARSQLTLSTLLFALGLSAIWLPIWGAVMRPDSEPLARGLLSLTAPAFIVAGTVSFAAGLGIPNVTVPHGTPRLLYVLAFGAGLCSFVAEAVLGSMFLELARPELEWQIATVAVISGAAVGVGAGLFLGRLHGGSRTSIHSLFTKDRL